MIELLSAVSVLAADAAQQTVDPAISEGQSADAGRAIALGVGGGLGAVGAGVGIGLVFSKMIEATARQPAMRGELTGLQWLGFALCEACFFYGLVAGLIAFFL